MQAKELIEALRIAAKNEPMLLTMPPKETEKAKLFSQAADALEATLWRDDVENAPKDGRLMLWDKARGIAISGCWHDEPAIDTPNVFEPAWSWWVSDDDLIMWDDGSAPDYWRPLTPPEAE